MELSSPVASLVPGLVDNAVVTFGDWLYWSAAIPFRRVPVFASWAVVSGKERRDDQKGKRQKGGGCDSAGNAARCRRHRHWRDGDLRCSATGSGCGKRPFLPD